VNAPLTIVGLGELLWDLFPVGRQLGGAPANFAYCSHLLGDNGTVVSRVGADELGNDIRESLAAFGLSDDFLESDEEYPTGTVGVTLDQAGQPFGPAALAHVDDGCGFSFRRQLPVGHRPGRG